MKRAQSGRITTISSGAGLQASLTGIQAYCSAKHAVVGFTRQMAHELGPYGITVNSVAPGLIPSNPASAAQWDSYGAEKQAAMLRPSRCIASAHRRISPMRYCFSPARWPISSTARSCRSMAAGNDPPRRLARPDAPGILPTTKGKTHPPHVQEKGQSQS